MVRRSAFVVALSFALAGGADAQPPVPEAVQAIAGNWEISDPSRERRCAVTFGVELAAGGFRIGFDAGCVEAFASLEAVVAWTPASNNAIRLIDAAGGALMEFTEVESGMYESDRRADGLLFLQTQAALKIETRTAEQMTGDWQLLREAGKPLCRLTFTDTPDGEGAYRLVVRPGCATTIAGAGLASWRLDRDQLILAGRSGTWRFAESDVTVWERVPLSTQPLLLVRP
jgi:hypothetical protein